MLNEDEYIRSNVLDSVSGKGGLVVLQLVIRNDGLYDVYRAVRMRLPTTLKQALPVEEARKFWGHTLREMFKRMTDESDEIAMLVEGRLNGIFPPEPDPAPWIPGASGPEG